jgi:hypothetical protein
VRQTKFRKTSITFSFICKIYNQNNDNNNNRNMVAKELLLRGQRSIGRGKGNEEGDGGWI